MAELSAVELAEFQRGMTDNQKLMFLSQYNSVRKDRSIALILSVLAGYLGFDRFYANDIGIGVIKLLTGGLCGVLYISDWILISDRIDLYNRGQAKDIAAAVLMPDDR